MVTLEVNGKSRAIDVPADMPLLWTLRDVLAMTGTKFGCGQGLCGACTIHIDGRPTRSCITPVSAAFGKHVTTIEGIGATPVGSAFRPRGPHSTSRNAAIASRGRSCRPPLC